MSTSVTVAEIKENLGIRHDFDDDKIYRFIENAEDECRQFMNRDQLPQVNPESNSPEDESESEPVSDSSTLAPSVRQAIYLLVEAAYDDLSVDEMEKMRKLAEVKLFPYRLRLGV